MARDLLSTRGMWSHSQRSVPLLSLLVALSQSARAEQIQPLEDLRRTIESSLAARLDNSVVRTHVTAVQLDPRLRLQSCALPLQAIIPPTLRDAARMTIGVRCGKPAWTVYVPVAVESELPVLVLRQAAARNASLSPEDVATEQRRVPGLATGYLTDPTQLKGRHLRQAAGPGTALTPDHFAADLLIRRGQRVTLVASAGGIEVHAEGEAISDGTAGSRIKVLNLSSSRVVEGQVETASRIRVSL